MTKLKKSNPIIQKSERAASHLLAGCYTLNINFEAPNAATADNPKKPQPGAGVSSIQMKVTTAVGRKIEREAKQNAEQLNKLHARRAEISSRFQPLLVG